MSKDTSEKEKLNGILDYYKNFDSMKAPVFLNVEEVSKSDKNKEKNKSI